MPKLQRHPKSGMWRVRARVPDDCRAVVRRSEILHSLDTKDEKEARRRAYPILDEIEKLFRRARAGEPVRWSNGKVLEPADDYYEVLASQFFIARTAELEHGDLELDRFPEGYDLQASLERFLREKGILYRRDSETFTNLLGEIRSELPSEGASPKKPTKVAPQKERVSTSEDDTDIPLSMLLERYLAEVKPSAQTSEEWKTVVRRFTDFLGDDADVRSVSVAQVRKFKGALTKLPRNLTLAERKLPFTNIIDRPDDRTPISGETVRKHIACLIAMFRWGVKNSYLDSNPADGLKPNATRQKEARLPFEWGEINQLLRSPMYIGCKSKSRRSLPGDLIIKDAQYWILLILLFTGARLEEIGQANVSDVRHEEGTHYLSIRDVDDDQRVKTEESRRRVPLHSLLVDLGFLEYVASLGTREERKLFPDLRQSVWKGRKKWTASLSKKLNDYIDAIGISDKRKSVHSLRHVMKTAMDESDIEDKYQNAILGHAEDRGGRWYGKGLTLKSLGAAMARISFPELNIEHLKRRPSPD